MLMNDLTGLAAGCQLTAEDSVRTSVTYALAQQDGGRVPIETGFGRKKPPSATKVNLNSCLSNRTSFAVFHRMPRAPIGCLLAAGSVEF